MTPLQWTPFKDGRGYREEVWNTLGTAQTMALMALHRNVITLGSARRELAARKPPLIAETLDELTPRGHELAQWAIDTRRWIS